MSSAHGEMLEAVEGLAGAVDRFDVVDLAHRLEPGIPSWPSHPRYCHDLMESYTLGDASCHYQLLMGEHSGTHFDAPLHFVADGPGHYGIDRVPLSSFLARAATIEAAGTAPDTTLTDDDVRVWEREHGAIRAGDAVMIHFGWDQRWKLRPDAGPFLRDWPGLSRDACRYLVEKGVRAVCCDCLSIDAFSSPDYAAHHTLLGAGVVIGENFNQLGRLPAFSYLIAQPLPIQGGSGSPVRPLALVPRGEVRI